MSSFPETSEELEEFFKGFFEACREQDKTTGDFQQGPSIPEITKDSMFNGDQMTAPGRYQASYEYHMIDPPNQVNRYGQMTSSCAENIYRGELEILGGEQALHGYQTAVYRGHQNLSVDLQVTSPVGSPHIYDWHTKTPGFNTIHPQINKTNSSEKENLLQYAETIASYADTFHFGQMKTTPVDENVCPGQKRSPNVEGSRGPQRTSFGNPTPYLGASTCPSSPFVSQSQHLGSISVSPSVQGWLPQKKSDMVTQKHVTQKKAPSLKRYSCSFQDCEKSYTCHLKDHMKKHNGEKPYRCSEPECPWTFFRSSDLRRHQRKHRGKRPYPCATCNKNFSRLYYLKTHQKVCIPASTSAGN